MKTYETPRGWVAIHGSLGARGSTPAEAQLRLAETEAIVKRLNGRSVVPQSRPDEPADPTASSARPRTDIQH
jgi:hypothetical protein